MSGGVALGQGPSVALFDNFEKWTTDSDLLTSLAAGVWNSWILLVEILR